MRDVAMSGFHDFSRMFSCWSAVFIVEKAFSYPVYGTDISGLCASCTIAWSISHPGELHGLPWHPVMGVTLRTAKKHSPTM